MKQVVETFVTLIIVAFSMVLIACLIGQHTTITEARDYHSVVVSRLESSNFLADIDEIKAEAESKGYVIEIYDMTVYEGKKTELVRLTYNIEIPLLGISFKTGTIEGYAGE